MPQRPSRVRERLISALIPDALGPPGEGAGVPLPVLPALSRLHQLRPTELVVSTTRMDRSGRIHERILLRELGWNSGTRLDMDTLHGLILIAATPTNPHDQHSQHGQHTVDHRGAIKLPAPLRRLAGITYGPPLVLAAALSEQVLVVHPSTLVADLLATHYTGLIQSDHTTTEPHVDAQPDLRTGIDPP